MVQGRIACSEIIQRDPRAQSPDLVQYLFHTLHIVDRKTFRYFQCQIVRIDPRPADRFFYCLYNIRLQQLYDRQIDINLKLGMSMCIPVLTCLTCLFHYMVSNRINEPEILCQRNKIRRWNKAECCGIPSDQRFCTDTWCSFLLDINDRLIIYLELLVITCRSITHIFFHIQSFIGSGADIIGIYRHSVFATLFGFVHGDIRFLDQILYTAAILWEIADPHTHRAVIICIF